MLLNSNYLFADENIDNQVKKISEKLRCMTCQNQSIHDSDAEFSKMIKKIIKQKLVEGGREKEITEFLIKRYGEYIIFEPQFNRKNLFLWIFPFFILIVSALLLIKNIKNTK